MSLFPVLSTSVSVAYSTSAVAAASALTDGVSYQFFASSSCWIRQGTSKLVTCVTLANLADTDTLTINSLGVTRVYAFDKAGDGVTAGQIQVDVSGDTTAAEVAATLAAAIVANNPELTVTDPTNGTLIIGLPESRALEITEQVANAGFTVATGVMQATAGTGSMFVPAGKEVLLKGQRGGQLGVIRDTADGKSSTVKVGSDSV